MAQQEIYPWFHTGRLRGQELTMDREEKMPSSRQWRAFGMCRPADE